MLARAMCPKQHGAVLPAPPFSEEVSVARSDTSPRAMRALVQFIDWLPLQTHRIVMAISFGPTSAIFPEISLRDQGAARSFSFTAGGFVAGGRRSFNNVCLLPAAKFMRKSVRSRRKSTETHHINSDAAAKPTHSAETPRRTAHRAAALTFVADGLAAAMAAMAASAERDDPPPCKRRRAAGTSDLHSERRRQTNPAMRSIRKEPCSNSTAMFETKSAARTAGRHVSRGPAPGLWPAPALARACLGLDGSGPSSSK
mmetsp:Transcript_24089/g.60125  ORF Transcript_24089/g.60125 Transcript_24089/m.60125 type:complete len:256 (-) Transcript_24089:815-1582(-)